MPAGIRALRRIQIGKEATPGAGGAATLFLTGTLGMALNQEIHQPNQWETGRLASFEQSEVIASEVALPFDSDASYEQLAYLLHMGIEVGTIATNTIRYSPNYYASNPPQTYVFEYGDDVQSYAANYVFARQLELSGQVGQVVSVRADLVGRQMNEATIFTGETTAVPPVFSINPPPRETIKMAHAQFKADPLWTNVGTTDVPGTLVDFNWRFMNGYTPQRFADRTLFFSEIAEAKRHVELDLTVAFNATTKAWFEDLYRVQEYQVFALEFINNVTGTLVPADDKSLSLQVGGKITQYATLTEREGQDIVKIKIMSEFDDTGARDMRVILDPQAAVPGL